MRLFSYAIILLLCAGVVSCDNQKDKKIAFDSTERLVADKIPLNQIVDPIWLTLTSEYLFISSGSTDTMIWVYSLPDLKYANCAGRKGRGPDEIQDFPMFCSSETDTLLYVWGYKPGLIKKIHVDNNGEFILDKDIDLVTFDSCNNIYIDTDSTIIYLADLEIKKYDIKGQKTIASIEYENDPSLGSFNYCVGYLATKGNYMVYVYRLQKKIDIYDKNDFSLLVTLSDEKTYPHPSPYAPEEIVWQYCTVKAGKDNFYALYSGEKYQAGATGKSFLEVFDYKGNPKKRYEFDMLLSTLAVDERRGYVYGYSQSDPDFLLRYKIDIL